MASKKALLGGQQIKVENRSGFDKSRFNAFTAPLGAIVPMVKQLCIPGKVKLSINLSAQLPPLASDAFLRTHLKVEAFKLPLRILYGGFQSWFAGEFVNKGSSTGWSQSTLGRAKLPRLCFDSTNGIDDNRLNIVFGVHTLMDYFGVKWPLGPNSGKPNAALWPNWSSSDKKQYFNIFPFLAYQMIYDHWYRNKLVERPLFAPPEFGTQVNFTSALLPHVSQTAIKDVVYDVSTGGDATDTALLNGSLLWLRQRNYGYDYFTTALPSAQDGQPMSVDTSSGSFTISALRVQNYAQKFAEINQLAGPDYVQVNRARYGASPSSMVAQKPVLLGSADFPMFTSGVEQTSEYATGNSANPFAGMAARYGRAHAEGSEFVCEADIDEPSYLMVMCSLVPDANYAQGISHDMRIFTEEGSITDLPVASLEAAGLDAVFSEELGVPGRNDQYQYNVFGYQPRYMWHKAGQMNEVHGLFRRGASLDSFIPQRNTGFGGLGVELSTDFLKVQPTDLDNVTAVSGDISRYGVMVDSSIKLFVSEPLGESVLPSLVDPAYEHGRDVYVRRGGIGVE